MVLAGDIGVGTGGIEWAMRHFPDVPVLYVPGNHEYYAHDIHETDLLSANSSSHIRILDNDTHVICGVRFLGTTLWTDFLLYGEGESWFSRETARRQIDDFASIRCGGRSFTPEDSVALHEASKAWLVGELVKGFNGPTVVITHHLPAAPSIAERYRNDPMNPAFASRLESVIEQYKPEL